MFIDAVTFRTIAKSILPKGTSLSEEEARAIVRLAYLAAGADLEDNPDEIDLRRQLVTYVCAIGGIAPDSVPPPSPLPVDAEERWTWLDAVAPQLASPGARELGYVVAYLLAAGDLELAPVEATFITDLQDALDLDDERASDVIAKVGAIITPDVGGEPTSAEATVRH